MDEHNSRDLALVPLLEAGRLDDPPHHLLGIRTLEPEFLSLAQVLALQAGSGPRGNLLDIAQSGQGVASRFPSGQGSRVGLGNVQHVVFVRVSQGANSEQERGVRKWLDGTGRSVEEERGGESIGLFEVVRQCRAMVLGNEVQGLSIQGPLDSKASNDTCQ